ncbi:MAG: hypothetical protein JWP02_841, partial [Acidimicrobiales bacterium]|nr:hypothetical protein [Acidimicrobiales bacterium]
MDNVATLQRVIDESKRVVGGVSSDQLGNKTLCTEWTVRDIINHITGGATVFAMSAEQGSVPDELMGQLMGGDNLGDDFKGAFNTAADRAMSAFSIPDVLDKIVKLPFGEMPAGIALNIAIVDVATHACDIAQATSQKIQDTELLDAALELGKQIIQPAFRQPGVFGDEKPCASDAPA